MLVRGEPGIGKSRLLDAFGADVRSQATRARVECRSFAQVPLAPLDDLLDRLSIRLPDCGTSLDRRFTAAAAALSALAERKSVIVMVEDLHWAHRDFLEALKTLVRAAASRRILFVATYRAEEFGNDHAGFALLGQLIRDPIASVIELEPLDPVATRRLLVASLDDAALPEESRLVAIARRSGGNPLFAEELLRDAIDGVATSEAEDIPLSIRGIVAERLARCTDSERSLASVAALAGRRFNLDVFEVVGLDAVAGAAAIETLCALQLIDVDPTDARNFVFRHALVRDAIASTVGPAARAPLHAAIAAALAARADRDTYAVEIAHHRFAAGERAAADFVRAGIAARAALDFVGAVMWFERAAEAARLAGDRDIAFDARIRAATAAFAGSDGPRGERELVAVIAESRVERDLATFVRASRLLSGFLTNDGRNEAGVDVLTSALRTLGDARPEDANAIRLRLAGAVAHRDERTFADALASVDAAFFGAGTVEAGEYQLLRAQLAARSYDLTTWEAAHASARELGPSGETSRGAWQRFAFFLQAWEALALGDLRNAERGLARAAEASKVTMGLAADVDVMRVFFSLAVGDRSACARALDEMPRSGSLLIRCYRAIAVLELARLGDERDVLPSEIDPSLLARARASGDGTLFARLAIAHAVTERALGREASARALAHEALDAVGEPYGLVPALLQAARLGPDLAARAESLLECDARASDLPFFAAASHLARAERDRVRDPVGAAAAAAVAGPIFEAAGWRLLALRSRELAGDVDGAGALARRLGDDAARRRLAAGTALEHLSDRERQIAALVARGKTNRAIGASLAIAEKTVEKHLTMMYGKLAVRSRAELVARLGEVPTEPTSP